jgi:hypothetical protein
MRNGKTKSSSTTSAELWSKNRGFCTVVQCRKSRRGDIASFTVIACPPVNIAKPAVLLSARGAMPPGSSGRVTPNCSRRQATPLFVKLTMLF